MIKVDFFTFNPLAENTYLLTNEKQRRLLLTPAVILPKKKTAAKFYNEKNIKPVQLINTHCHLDHVFGNEWVRKNYDLELYIHEGEKLFWNLARNRKYVWIKFYKL